MFVIQCGRLRHWQLPLKHREDDTESAIARRLKIYADVTSQVIKHYDKQNKVIMINGDAPIEQVAAEIEAKVFSDEG